MNALSEQELLQICRKYEITCTVCGTPNAFFRLKPDICRPGNQEGDGHPRVWRWNKPGFDTVDPKQLFWGICKKCRFAGELDDADFRTCDKDPDAYKAQFSSPGLERLVSGSLSDKTAVQALGKLIAPNDLFASAIAQFHLGIFSHCLRHEISPGSMARYYLRLAWVYRDQETYYAGANTAALKQQLTQLKTRWEAELPRQKEYPVPPGLALDEAGALQFSRAYFQRNYETLRESSTDDELRLRYLLAEIGFRIYWLTNTEEDYRKGLSFFSGAMQQCMTIINDKSISGGIVNKARGMLETTGERGRELRELYKQRGGKGGEAEEPAPPRKEKRESAPAAVPPPQAKAAPAPKSEEAKETKLPSESSGNRLEADQLTRQVQLLKEEVGTLRDRVKVLEEDNEKWRQMVGKDPLTGLPNRTFLFRVALPKSLRSLAESGPLSCIGLGLDQVARINTEQGWQMGDRMIQEAVKAMRKLLGKGEELYRLEGVNFVVFGKMDGNQARQRSVDIRRQLASASVQVEKTIMPLTASLGVVTVERQVGKSQTEAANAIFQALIDSLYRARQKGGNTVEVHANTRF